MTSDLGCPVAEASDLTILHSSQLENFYKSENFHKPITEMQQLSALSDFAFVYLTRSYFQHVLETHASNHAGALCTAEATFCEQQRLLEDARYTAGPRLSSDQSIKYAQSKRLKVAFTHEWMFDAHKNDLESEAIFLAKQ